MVVGVVPTVLATVGSLTLGSSSNQMILRLLIEVIERILILVVESSARLRHSGAIPSIIRFEHQCRRLQRLHLYSAEDLGSRRSRTACTHVFLSHFHYVHTVSVGEYSFQECLLNLLSS